MRGIILGICLCAAITLTACKAHKAASAADSAAGSAQATDTNKLSDSSTKGGLPASHGLRNRAVTGPGRLRGSSLDSGKHPSNAGGDSTLNGGGSGPGK